MAPGPQPIEIDPDDERRWSDLRARAKAEREKHMLDSTPSQHLDAVAWVAGSASEADELMQAVHEARQVRATWKEIAAAAGTDGTAEDARRLSDRYKFWRSSQGD